MRFVALVAVLGMALASLATPATAAQGTTQTESGSVRLGAPRGDEVARRAWNASGGAVNGVTGYVFRIDPNTLGGTFQFTASGKPLTLRFYNRIDDDTIFACSWHENVTSVEESPCGAFAVVTAANREAGSFTYRAHKETVVFRERPKLESPPAPTVDNPVPAIPAADATAYQVNAAHTGRQADGSSVRAGLRHAWSANLGGPVSYPVIAEGRAFVTVRDVDRDAYGTFVVALDLADGDVEWANWRDGSYWDASLTYESGRLFFVGGDTLEALDPATGETSWLRPLAGTPDSPPTAFGGQVFIVPDSKMTAVDAATGQIQWRSNVMYGDKSAPAVDESGVYASYACNQAFSFERMTGVQRWHHDSDCAGGGGRTTVLHGGRLYTRDYDADLILDAATGREVGTYDADYAPAFDAARRFTITQWGPLVATDIATGKTLWQYLSEGELTTAPLVVNDMVVVGDDAGMLSILEADSGALLWKGSIGAPIPAPDEHNSSQPLTGMAAGGGMLLIPTDGSLVAFTNR